MAWPVGMGADSRNHPTAVPPISQDVATESPYATQRLHKSLIYDGEGQKSPTILKSGVFDRVFRRAFQKSGRDYAMTGAVSNQISRRHSPDR